MHRKLVFVLSLVLSALLALPPALAGSNSLSDPAYNAKVKQEAAERKARAEEARQRKEAREAEDRKERAEKKRKEEEREAARRERDRREDEERAARRQEREQREARDAEERRVATEKRRQEAERESVAKQERERREDAERAARKKEREERNARREAEKPAEHGTAKATTPGSTTDRQRDSRGTDQPKVAKEDRGSPSTTDRVRNTDPPVTAGAIKSPSTAERSQTTINDVLTRQELASLTPEQQARQKTFDQKSLADYDRLGKLGAVKNYILYGDERGPKTSPATKPEDARERERVKPPERSEATAKASPQPAPQLAATESVRRPAPETQTALSAKELDRLQLDELARLTPAQRANLDPRRAASLERWKRYNEEDKQYASEAAAAKERADKQERRVNKAQLGLSTVGEVPGVGAASDLANCALSIGRKDKVGTALDCAALAPGMIGAAAGAAGITRRVANLENSGKAAWTSTKSQSEAENALRHFRDHGADFDAKNVDDYVTKAQDFLQSPGPGVLSKVRANGDVVRFDPATNTFGVMDKSGSPRTFYKPDPAKHGYPTNLDYFYAQ